MDDGRQMCRDGYEGRVNPLIRDINAGDESFGPVNYTVIRGTAEASRTSTSRRTPRSSTTRGGRSTSAAPARGSPDGPAVKRLADGATRTTGSGGCMATGGQAVCFDRDGAALPAARPG